MLGQQKISSVKCVMNSNNIIIKLVQLKNGEDSSCFAVVGQQRTSSVKCVMKSDEQSTGYLQNIVLNSSWIVEYDRTIVIYIHWQYKLIVEAH